MNKGDLLRIALHKDLEKVQENVDDKANKKDTQDSFNELEVKLNTTNKRIGEHEKPIHEGEKHGVGITELGGELKFFDGYEWKTVEVDEKRIRINSKLPLEVQVSDVEPIAEDGRIYFNSEQNLYYVSRNGQWYRLFAGGDEKLDREPPKEAPKLNKKTDTTVVLEGNGDMEFRYQGGSWQEEPFFSNLQRNETYKFEQRYKVDEIYKASPPSPALEVTTDKGEQTPPSKPNVEIKELSSSVQVMVNATGSSQEVALMSGTSKPSESDWKQDREVYNCKFEITYTAYARKKETHTHKSSKASEGYTFTTPEDGIPLRDLPVGSIITYAGARIYNKPIEWMKLEDNHYGMNKTTLIAKDIIKYMCVDAKEPRNSNSNRRGYGNNRYIHSNIHQWLNSDKTSWYSDAHSSDQAPNKNNVYSDRNPYDNIPGFMNAWNQDFKKAILNTSLKVVKSSTDGGGMDTFNAKVFCLSRTEAGLGNENGAEDGTPFSYFDSDNRRKAVPTADAKANNDDSRDNAIWWLRTPHADGSHDVRSVGSVGSLNTEYAYDGSYGVRPALNFPSSLRVGKTPNNDGSYNLKF